MGDDDNIYKDFESHYQIRKSQGQEIKIAATGKVGNLFCARMIPTILALSYMFPTLDEIKDLLTLDKEMFQLINSFSKSGKK